MPRRSNSKPSHKAAAEKPDPAQRLQRLLASAGFGSRRQCEALIEAGRVEVDGKIVTRLGTTADPAKNKVRVDGVLLRKQKLVYYAVNKPVGVVTTNSDPQGRPRVVDLVPKSERVFAVGRLDRSSEGLILLTNDGDLAQHLTHPRYGVRKVYRVTVAGKVDGETMRHMRKGIYIAEGHVRVEGARILKSRSRATELEIVLREGKNREIRRILARLGHKVQHLRRIAIGPLRLADMPPGAYRVVSREEVRRLREDAAHDTGGDELPTKPIKRGTKKSSSRKRADSRASAGRSAGKLFSKPQTSTRRRDHRRSPIDDTERPLTIGAVIGGDPAEAESPRRKGVKGRRSVGNKRAGTKRSAGNRSGIKRGRPTGKVTVAKKRAERKRKH